MKLLVHPKHWITCFLILWTSSSEADNPDVCQQEKSIDNLQVQSFPAQCYDEVDIEENENFSCFLYPTNLLNCSWSFHKKDAGLSVYISVCANNRTLPHLSIQSGERVGSRSMSLQDENELFVILHFNMSLCSTWSYYTYAYNTEMLEVLSPPRNISAAVKDGGLVVTWALPPSRSHCNPSCFEYQLDLGEQETPSHITDRLSYMMPNADPTSTYRVRMRARKVSVCVGSPQWSAWSHAVFVEQSDSLSVLVIISISLGIPMILLAFLLLVRHSRVCKILFPPIPRPPPKYKYFLEEKETFSFYHPVSPISHEEEITEVADEEKQPEKTIVTAKQPEKSDR